MLYDYRNTYGLVYSKLKRYGKGSPEKALCPAIVDWARQHRLRRVHVLMCGFGYAVAALRRAGVEAFGVEIAAKPLWRIRRYVTRGDVIDYTSNLKPYSGDGIVTIDGLEHLEESDLMRVLDGASKTGGPLFGQVSCREDVYGSRLVGKPLHLTVRPWQWWNEQLARRWQLSGDNFCKDDDSYLWTGTAREAQGIKRGAA